MAAAEQASCDADLVDAFAAGLDAYIDAYMLADAATAMPSPGDTALIEAAATAALLLPEAARRLRAGLD
jgi:hypothetical protein